MSDPGAASLRRSEADPADTMSFRRPPADDQQAWLDQAVDVAGQLAALGRARPDLNDPGGKP